MAVLGTSRQWWHSRTEQRGVSGEGTKGSYVKDMATDDAKQTCGGVVQDTVPNGLATDAVLLCSEVEGPVVGLPDRISIR